MIAIPNDLIQFLQTVQEPDQEKAPEKKNMFMPSKSVLGALVVSEIKHHELCMDEKAGGRTKQAKQTFSLQEMKTVLQQEAKGVLPLEEVNDLFEIEQQNFYKLAPLKEKEAVKILAYKRIAQAYEKEIKHCDELQKKDPKALIVIPRDTRLIFAAQDAVIGLNIEKEFGGLASPEDCLGAAEIITSDFKTKYYLLLKMEAIKATKEMENNQKENQEERKDDAPLRPLHTPLPRPIERERKL